MKAKVIVEKHPKLASVVDFHIVDEKSNEKIENIEGSRIEMTENGVLVVRASIYDPVLEVGIRRAPRE